LRPSVIIIDEPEAGLHLYALNVFSEMVHQASTESQILLSTQSADLLDNFDPDDILVTNKSDSGTEFTRLNREEFRDWLDDYSLGDLWKKNIFGGRLAR